MKTVKQVSDLTGISVRMLHYYDEIGLLKPSEHTEVGYRLYDDEALMILQQILFYKELDIPLKEVKEMMYSPHYNIMQTLNNQKKLLILKCNRLNDLVELINKTLKGENDMSFKEFDMSEYYIALEEFKKEHEDYIIKTYGSTEKYNEFIEKCKANESGIAKMAIDQYGSIEKYVKAMKKNLQATCASNREEQIDEFKKDCLEDRHPKLKELYKNLVSDLSKDPSSSEIQQIAKEITTIAKTDYEIFKMNAEYDYWYVIVQSFLVFPDWMNKVDQKYGVGASKFIGEALTIYLGDYKPKLEILYQKLVSDFNKDPSSKEIQELVEEIVDATQKINDALEIDEGENYWGYTAQQYLSETIMKRVIDKKYGNGSAKFIGEALKFYSENKSVML